LHYEATSLTKAVLGPPFAAWRRHQRVEDVVDPEKGLCLDVDPQDGESYLPLIDDPYGFLVAVEFWRPHIAYATEHIDEYGSAIAGEHIRSVLLHIASWFGLLTDEVSMPALDYVRHLTEISYASDLLFAIRGLERGGSDSGGFERFTEYHGGAAAKLLDRPKPEWVETLSRELTEIMYGHLADVRIMPYYDTEAEGIRALTVPTTLLAAWWFRLFELSLQPDVVRRYCAKPDCGQAFTTTRKRNKKFCSESCKHAVNQKIYAESEGGRATIAKRLKRKT
jgi:hypothetical protein